MFVQSKGLIRPQQHTEKQQSKIKLWLKINWIYIPDKNLQTNIYYMVKASDKKKKLRV